MISVQILGTGCSKCKKLAENADKAIAESGVEAVVEKVTDVKAIMGYGVMTTPALAVNGRVKLAGKVASVQEITDLLKNQSGG